MAVTSAALIMRGVSNAVEPQFNSTAIRLLEVIANELGGFPDRPFISVARDPVGGRLMQFDLRMFRQCSIRSVACEVQHTQRRV
jgi:hypothetical protein